ncbi:hypothetical protein NKR23_g11795 [Pleurostoma richardsiae]|uniref:Uncharacterized protein n=1 Tax=Pleurostoma richardsiae TaxID=41990 RepID=A0AA38RIC7_9PEZI|nr:hypothetical protein NKR23_g11795 [Pleurostoma richardsiae]
MPVTGRAAKSAEEKEALWAKLRRPDEEIVKLVLDHLGVKGHGEIRSTLASTEVSISTPCMIFIVLGNVIVGTERLSDRGTAYKIENEDTITLGDHTSVVLVSD